MFTALSERVVSVKKDKG